MNLLSLLSELVRHDADATVAIDADPRQPVTVSSGELWRRTLRLRADLSHAGVGRGDCVAVWLPNWSDALVWQFATASLGAHVIGVNTRYNVDEVRHVLDRARPKVMAVAHEFHGLDLIGRLREAVGRAEAPAPAVAVVAGPHGSAPDDPAGYDVGAGAWIPTPASQLPDAETETAESDGDELAVAFTTSGSTGMPKLAAHSESAVVAHAFADARGIGIREGDVVLCVLPLSGVFGFNTAMAALAGGAACLLEPVFDEDAVVADMERYGVTQLVGGDDMVSRVEQAWRRRPRDLSAWRWLGVADFIGRSKELAAWARDEFGTLTSGVYGSSEVFALTLFWPHDEPEPRRWSGGGRLVSPGMAARTVDPVTERVLSPGEQGELQLRGPTVVDAYLGDPAAAARSFTADGWFRTGDLAVIAPDGGVEYVCRMGDVLRLRGFLVDPAEIEFRLAAHEAVQTAKVVGVRDATGETVAVGFVVPVAGRSADEQELRAWCAATLARFKVPTAIHVIDEMPTTSGTNGSKIRAVILREWAQQRLSD
ncbi:AMP-binding protein [Planosporangium sp. 12N6]|uniref:AMP-binding protein n=1 Tax=Planosporangium spinosum TaxID=3402278 RepID=UPI003CEF0099